MAFQKRSGIFKKWWVRTIRERNYFGFRYWWFNWLLLIASIFLFSYFLPKNYEAATSCNQLNEVKSYIEEIKHTLENCCSCSKEVKDSVAIDCPDRILAFQVCNSNAAKDDNFDVYLNDVNIGKLDLNTNQQVGSVFLATNDNTISIKQSDFICPISNMNIYYFDPRIIKFGKNKIRLKNTQNNHNDNLGTIEIRNYLLMGKELSDPCKIKNIPYQMNSGQNFNINFNYTRCCE
jgi:hypothetical protein